jgi:hypothetical protein
LTTTKLCFTQSNAVVDERGMLDDLLAAAAPWAGATRGLRLDYSRRMRFDGPLGATTRFEHE